MIDNYKSILNSFVIFGCLVGGYLFSKAELHETSSLFVAVIVSIIVLSFRIDFGYRLTLLFSVAVLAALFAHSFLFWLIGGILGFMYMLSINGITK